MPKLNENSPYRKCNLYIPKEIDALFSERIKTLDLKWPLTAYKVKKKELIVLLMKAWAQGKQINEQLDLFEDFNVTNLPGVGDNKPLSPSKNTAEQGETPA